MLKKASNFVLGRTSICKETGDSFAVEKTQAVLKITVLIAAWIMISGCDLHMQGKLYFCNGFDQPVISTDYIGDAEWVKTFSVYEFPKGACTDSWMAVTHSLKRVEDARVTGTLPAVGMTVKNQSGEIVARYDDHEIFQISWRLGVKAPVESIYYWLMTGNGLFYIPANLVDDWQIHIAQIEQKSPSSIPNGARK